MVTNKLNKMTAVEWLIEQLFELRNPTLNQIEIIEQAKEMEKEQQGYTEEEVLEFSNWCRIQDNKYPNRVITIQQLFEQFKKK